MTAFHLKPNTIYCKGLRILKTLASLNLWLKVLIFLETPIFLLIMFQPLQFQYKVIEVVGYVSLLFLAYLDQKKTTVPFPFLVEISISDCIAYASLAYVSTWFLGSFSPLRSILIHGNPLIAINAGITEESFKVVLTNLLACLLFKRISRMDVRRVAVWAAGIISAVVWGFLHMLSRGYDIEFVQAAIFVGVAYFAIVYHKRNCVPVVFGHALYNMILPSLFFF
jgi:hypothetical protein